MSDNRSPKEGHYGVRHENKKEIERRNGKTLLYGRQEAQDKNHRWVCRNHRLQPKICHPHSQKQRTHKNNALQQRREKECAADHKSTQKASLWNILRSRRTAWSYSLAAFFDVPVFKTAGTLYSETISIILLISSVMMKHWKKNWAAYQVQRSAGF